MVKDIYIIKNYINNKVYVGQSVNAKQRWSAHLSNARLHKVGSAIDSAIGKYGAENFYYEILETTEDYDNREAYWIRHYNSLIPNGYNWCGGGNGTYGGVNSPSGKIRSDEELSQIVDDLIYSKKSQEKIALEHNVSKQIISRINRGTAYRLANFSYPLRKKTKDITEQEAETIRTLLSSRQYTVKEIAEQVKLPIDTIQLINKGKLLKNDHYNYPIYTGCHRKLSDEQIKNIIQDLLATKKKFSELALEYSISARQIRGINNGTSWHDDNLIYPLRSSSET